MEPSANEDKRSVFKPFDAKRLHQLSCAHRHDLEFSLQVRDRKWNIRTLEELKPNMQISINDAITPINAVDKSTTWTYSPAHTPNAYSSSTLVTKAGITVRSDENVQFEETQPALNPTVVQTPQRPDYTFVTNDSLIQLGTLMDRACSGDELSPYTHQDDPTLSTTSSLSSRDHAKPSRRTCLWFVVAIVIVIPVWGSTSHFLDRNSQAFCQSSSKWSIARIGCFRRHRKWDKVHLFVDQTKQRVVLRIREFLYIPQYRHPLAMRLSSLIGDGQPPVFTTESNPRLEKVHVGKNCKGNLSINISMNSSTMLRPEVTRTHRDSADECRVDQRAIEGNRLDKRRKALYDNGTTRFTNNTIHFWRSKAFAVSTDHVGNEENINSEGIQSAERPRHTKHLSLDAKQSPNEQQPEPSEDLFLRVPLWDVVGDFIRENRKRRFQRSKRVKLKKP